MQAKTIFLLPLLFFFFFLGGGGGRGVGSHSGKSFIALGKRDACRIIYKQVINL